MIYSIPIAIRITAFGIRGVAKSPVEASVSMGSTSIQSLAKVQLPMAKKTIVLGVNQTVMAALSFVVIAALIGAPGLGKPVIEALIIRNVGEGFVAGFAVVFLAIMLDRSTTAAVVKQNTFVPPSPAQQLRRKLGLTVAGIFTITSIFLSRQFAWAAYFPKELDQYEQEDFEIITRKMYNKRKLLNIFGIYTLTVDDILHVPFIDENGNIAQIKDEAHLKTFCSPELAKLLGI
jgi:hypothetical protein